jgi:hypothetical protein
MILDKTKESLLKGMDKYIDLLVITNTEQLLFILKLHISNFTKHHILMRRSNVLSLPLQ